MNLKTDTWEYFSLSKLFDVVPGKYYYADEYTDGNTPYCSASAENNGVGKKIDLSPDFTGNKIITGKVGCTAFYQYGPFCATSDVNVLSAKFDMSIHVGLFITAVINKNENFRWNYGRQCRVGNTKKITLKLPIQRDQNGMPIMDNDFVYSEKGYKPDFKFMEDYIKSLHHKSITTKNIALNSDLNISVWKEFLLCRLFDTGMGNGIDACITTTDDPQINYVSRDSNGNGVVAVVDKIEGEEIFPAGIMTLALGGSFLGSCFVQMRPFYTAQNVGVLKPKFNMTLHTKLFISTLIRNECKIKYQAFGRELNAHFRKDFTIKLPVKMNGSSYVLDETNTFSDQGYIPDWDWMDNYMKSLPFGDRLSVRQ